MPSETSPIIHVSVWFYELYLKRRDVAKNTLKAAREKNREKLIDLANDLSDACLMCHEKYRDVGPPGSPLRCAVPPPKPEAPMRAKVRRSP